MKNEPRAILVFDDLLPRPDHVVGQGIQADSEAIHISGKRPLGHDAFLQREVGSGRPPKDVSLVSGKGEIARREYGAIFYILSMIKSIISRLGAICPSGHHRPNNRKKPIHYESVHF